MNYDSLIARRVLELPPSGIRKFFDIVSEMKDAISLGVGEPDFVTPWNIREAAIYALEKGHTHYTSNWGVVELRREIARYLNARFQTEYNPASEIMVTVGASEGIDLAMRALLEPGDEVLVPSPSYVSYMPCVKLAGGVPVAVRAEAENAFRITPEAVMERMTPRTKVMVLPFPNNPTGAIMERGDLVKIARLIRGTDIIVVADEIYAELTYGRRHVSFPSLEGMWERTVLISGFSKAFAMTGWRVGYACGPAPIMAAMCKIHQYGIMCASTEGQAGAIEALRAGFNTGYAEVERMASEYNRRRNVMVSGFRAMGLKCHEPLGAFYVFPDITSTGMSSQAFAEQLLRAQKVAVVPGDAFGESGEGFVRCSYATGMDKLEEALRRIELFINGR